MKRPTRIMKRARFKFDIREEDIGNVFSVSIGNAPMPFIDNLEVGLECIHDDLGYKNGSRIFCTNHWFITRTNPKIEEPKVEFIFDKDFTKIIRYSEHPEERGLTLINPHKWGIYINFYY